jgi:rod shape-determining protein MreD
MFFFVFLFLGILTVCLQSTVLNIFPQFPVKPDLVILIIAYLGVFHEPTKGIIVAFILGFFLDTLSGSPTGLFSFLRIITFLFVWMASSNLYLKNALSQIFLIILLSIIDGVLFILFMYILSASYNIWPFFIVFLPIQAILTAIICPWVFNILDKTSNFIRPTLKS